MIEKNNGPIESCPKLKTYEFSNISELADFEDQIALDICPSMDSSDIIDWANRIDIRSALRIKKGQIVLNCSYTNIVLSEMSQSYENLYNATERGLKFDTTLGVPIKKHSSDNIDFFKESTRGFILTAEAKTTGIGTIGYVSSEIYFSMAPQKSNGRYSHSRPGADVIRRYITQPTLEQLSEEEFISKKKLSAETIKQVGRAATSFNITKRTNVLNVL